MTMTTALPTAELRPYALNWADSFVALAFVVFVTGALYSARKIIAQDSPEYKAATAAALAAGSISGAPLSHTAVKPHTFSATKRVGTPAPPFAPNAVSGTPVSLDSTPKGARTPVEPIVPSLDDYRTVRRRKLRPLKPVYHMTMGLRNSTPGELITIDEDYLDRVEQRAKLVAVKGNAVHGVVPNTDGAAAVRELYAYLLGTNLPERYPGIFSVLPAENESGKRHTKSSVTGKTVPTIVSDTSDSGAEAALRVLGTTVEEDMFILQEEPDGSHRCVAFMCCFPSGFDPASKLGEGLAGIHAPVPSYDKIGPSMERFFGRMEAGKPVCRQNWSVQTHGELHNLASNHIKTLDDEVIDTDVDVSQTYLRVEFQTLTRLPETRALLFSFKTYLYSLADVKADGDGPALADAIEGLQKGNAPGMWVYKAAVRWGPKAVEFLRA